MHFLCCFRTPEQFLPPVAFQPPPSRCICAVRGRTMDVHDRPFQGMAWLSHLAAGCRRGRFRGLLCESVVQDMGRGHWENSDVG